MVDFVLNLGDPSRHVRPKHSFKGRSGWPLTTTKPRRVHSQHYFTVIPCRALSWNSVPGEKKKRAGGLRAITHASQVVQAQGGRRYSSCLESEAKRLKSKSHGHPGQRNRNIVVAGVRCPLLQRTLGWWFVIKALSFDVCAICNQYLFAGAASQAQFFHPCTKSRTCTAPVPHQASPMPFHPVRVPISGMPLALERK